MPVARCLTPSGVDVFRNYLASGAERTGRPPTALFDDPRHSRASGITDVAVEHRSFASRFGFAAYLDAQARASGFDGTLDEAGLWEWLTLFYFDEICPPATDGMRTIFNEVRYIPTAGSSWHYRHLLKGPYAFYRDHVDVSPDCTRLALSGPLDVHGGVYEHLVSRPRLRVSRGVQEAATLLYYDADRQLPKSGASTGGAAVQEFARLLRNLPAEYDLTTLSAGTILSLVPERFLTWLDDDARADHLAARELFGIDVGADPLPSATADPSHIADALTALESRPLTTMQRRIRSDRFRIGVIGAYDARCAVSGIGLVDAPLSDELHYEVEAAHIIPVAHNGSDVVQNGLALSRTLHWAFDRGLVWVDSDMRVRVRVPAVGAGAPDTDTDSRNDWLRQYGGRRLRLPTAPRLAPSTEALRWHAEHVAGVGGG